MLCGAKTEKTLKIFEFKTDLQDIGIKCFA